MSNGLSEELTKDYLNAKSDVDDRLIVENVSLNFEGTRDDRTKGNRIIFRVEDSDNLTKAGIYLSERQLFKLIREKEGVAPNPFIDELTSNKVQIEYKEKQTPNRVRINLDSFKEGIIFRTTYLNKEPRYRLHTTAPPDVPSNSKEMSRMYIEETISLFNELKVQDGRFIEAKFKNPIDTNGRYVIYPVETQAGNKLYFKYRRPRENKISNSFEKLVEYCNGSPDLIPGTPVAITQKSYTVLNDSLKTHTSRRWALVSIEEARQRHNYKTAPIHRKALIKLKSLI